jgi:predicted dehydrogenase
MTESGTIGAAVVGLGIGMAHVAAYLDDPHARLCAVADAWEPRRAAIGGTFSQGSMRVLEPLFRAHHERDGGLDRPWSAIGVDVYDDIGSILTDDRVELVSVCTPDDLHERHATDLIEAGKDILLEKPPALTIEGASSIRDRAVRNQRRVAVGFEFRVNPAVLALRGLVSSGRVGDVRAFTLYHVRTPFRRDKWERWIQRVDRSGGLLVEETCHWFDLARFVTGKEVGQLVCHADGGVHPDFDFEDIACIQGRYTDDTIFQISHSLCSHDFSLVLSVYGTEGSAWCGLKEQPCSSFDAGATDHCALLSYAPINASVEDAEVERWGEEATEPFNIRECARATIAALRETRPFPAEVEDGIAALEIALAARRSHREGRPITI